MDVVVKFVFASEIAERLDGLKLSSDKSDHIVRQEAVQVTGE